VVNFSFPDLTGADELNSKDGAGAMPDEVGRPAEPTKRKKIKISNAVIKSAL
jgi:hypothetical protein